MMGTKVMRAGCVIADQEGGVLMLHRAAAKQWQIPAALVAHGEDAETAAIRGVSQEVGIAVEVDRTLGSRPGAEDGIEDIWLLAHVTSGKPVLRDTETYDKWGFFSLISLTQRYEELSPATKNFLEAMAYGEIDLAI